MIRLGTRVKCTITGVIGHIVSHHQYLYGTDRVTIQPYSPDKIEVPDAYTCEIAQVEEVLKDCNVNTGFCTKPIKKEEE